MQLFNILFVVLSLILGLGVTASAQAHEADADSGGPQFSDAKNQILKTYPHIREVVMRGGSFGGPPSRSIANKMYSRTDAAAIQETQEKLVVEQHGPGTWLLRMPFVNVAVFETADGLVLFDSSYAPAGPALRKVLGQLSGKPIHTIVFTHYHADHAFGAWALLDMGVGGKSPEIVATEEFVRQLELDMKTFGVIARNNNQSRSDVPKSWAEAIRPTRLFRGTETLVIGGEQFVLTHARGETEDQLWGWVPSRRTVVTADYYQGFFPNAGNGKRRQRFPKEWGEALAAMADLKPTLALPMHGAAITSEGEIQDHFRAHAFALLSIHDQTLAGLNAGKMREEVVNSITLPRELLAREDMRQIYTSTKDVAKMVIHQYSGWWNDVPSQWNPATSREQAGEIVFLAGGIGKITDRARALMEKAPAQAAHLADIAWFAEPDNVEVIKTAIEVYAKRIGQDTTTQEALVYLEHLARLQARLTHSSVARSH